MSIQKPAALAALFLMLGTTVGAQEATKKTGLGRMEGPRDLNMIQVEPSIINERFYTRGDAERHQYVGHVLPAGAPIPDVEEPLSKQQNKAKPDAKPTAEVNKTGEAKAGETKSTETKPTEAKSPETKVTEKNRKSSDRGLHHQFVGKTLPAGAPIPDNE